MSHGVIRTDLMYGTDVGAALVSFKYYNAAGEPADIDNGCVVKLSGLLDGEREIYKAVDVAAGDKLEDCVIVATPEVMYDERKKNLDEFYNEAGVAARGYRFHPGQIFSITEDALAGTKAKGDVVELAAGTKLNTAAAATGDATVVGEILYVENTGRYTYYVIADKA